MPDEPTPELPSAGELPDGLAELLNRELTTVRVLWNRDAHVVRTSGPGARRTLCGRPATVTWPAYGATVTGLCGGCAEVATDVADALAVLYRERANAPDPSTP